jgi:hypothetical protein
MFVDGCAVLQFIKYEDEDKFKYLKIKNDQVVFVREDVFLLENQLPYQLLDDLMELSENKEKLKESIDRFIDLHANCKDKKTSICKEKPAHLLDCLRTRLFRNSEHNIKVKSGGQEVQDWQSYRNVKEIRAAGIQLKLCESSSLADVIFEAQRFSGYLSLPPITVDGSTGSKFMNLIAYEMCPDFDNDFGVTSYICFLDSLINDAEDVKELKEAHILKNSLGRDIEVARLFNDMGTDLVPNSEIYGDVKVKIQNYCNNTYNIYYIHFKLKTWINEVIRVHFSSPWAIVGLLAASAALVLTAIQTWYTVYSPPGPCDDFCLHRP